MNFRHLYRVETLDTRFAPKSDSPLPHTTPSKWRTPEYYFYYFCFLTIPFMMVKTVYDVSVPEHPQYKHYESLLSEGWIPGRKVDNSDSQFAGFRDQVPILVAVVGAHSLLRRLYDYLNSSAGPKTNERPDASDHRLNTRITFDLGFAAIFLIALHGVSALKILFILSLNYQIATALPKQYVGAATWTFNIGILFANELSNGYRFADLAAFVSPPQTGLAGTANWGAWVDSYGGLLPRWEVLFNITVLRLISFNFDYLWSLDRRAGSPIEKKNLTPATYTERDRVALGAQNPHDYTFRNYLAYILYTPLYLIGPILTFNDYIFQSRHPLPSISSARLGPYALRFVICILTMEFCLHYLYCVAISKSSPDWSIYTPFQLGMLAYFNCHIIWLKLLIPWRFFRLWSLTDSIDPPENMVRCASDNYSLMAFWRGWHRSFNRWIIRYMYIPMGGSRAAGDGGVMGQLRSALNYGAVFTFVALWHDLNLRLLIWGWLVVLFILPEALGRALFPAKRWTHHPNAYRALCGLGGVANLFTIMASSMVGFAVGLDGLKAMVQGIVGTIYGRLCLVGAYATVYVGVQIMFEWRASERRRGVVMNC